MNRLLPNIFRGRPTPSSRVVNQNKQLSGFENQDIDILWRALTYARNHGSVSTDEYIQVSKKFP